MKDFETKLQRQPVKQIPAEWRGDILSAARGEAVSGQRAVDTRPSLLLTLNSHLSTLLWPSPKAWAGLATVWMVIFILNFSARDESQVLVKQTPPPSPELIMVLKQQRRELAELAGLSAPGDADRPKSFLPRPRSDRRDCIQNA